MKTIKLTRGQVALVDDADYEWLSQWKWHAHRKTPRETFYARRNIYLGGGRRGPGRYKSLLMHRALLGLRQGDGVKADHQDGNGLNNQRYNLRICNSGQSAANRGVWHNSDSGFKGVFKVTTPGRVTKWAARVTYQGKSVSLGRFVQVREAAIAYDRAALEVQGAFARTNQSMGLL